jgi:hypothetical protein
MFGFSHVGSEICVFLGQATLVSTSSIQEKVLKK